MQTTEITPRDLPPQLIDVLRTKIELGDAVLFTGAGFSQGATAMDDQPLPSSRRLKTIFWPIGFPDVPEDEESSLGDVFDCAMSQSSSTVKRVLETCLAVNHSSLPDYYHDWLAIPWARVYTLNLDDLEAAAQRKFTLPRAIRSLSPTDTYPHSSSDLSYVHLNGQLKDFPNVTMSAPQYAHRLPGRDPWYSTLAADLVSRTVVFVGTTLDEPPLWQHLELRGARASGRELRPRSFLVTPTLSLARKQMLRSYNVEHVAMNANQFALAVLPHLQQAAAEGHNRISRARQSHGQRISIRYVSELRQESPEIDLNRYLLGREPTFFDISHGFAIQRSFENEIFDDSKILDAQITLIMGTAGTGKSTALRRLALNLDAVGQKVGWLDPRTVEAGIPALREAILACKCDYVVVDDVDVFGSQTGPLLRELADQPHAPRIIAAARSTRSERIDLPDYLEQVDAKIIIAPPLTDDDIDGLIEALRSAELLGRLAGMSLDDQRGAFKRLAGRQLLVAMIEATSGRKFQDKIDDECSQLPREQLFLYAVCALATRSRIGLELDEILGAIGESSSSQLERIDSLQRQFLIVKDRDGRLAVRHRVVADQVMAWLRKEGQLADPIEGLLFSMAVRYIRERNKASRAFRLMVRLLNHEFMIDKVRDDAETRSVYASVASILRDDGHYWLQRGSFELKKGDLDLAENYLNQALGLDGDDLRIRTAWSHMSLRRAAEQAQNADGGGGERAEEAMKILHDVIEARDSESYHAYHVLGSQGLHYARRARLPFEEKRSLMEGLVNTVSQGVKRHGYAQELRRLRDDLQREYLELAIPTQQKRKRKSARQE